MLKKFNVLQSLILAVLALLCQVSFAQNVGINSTGTAPDASAGLDVSFTDRGLLIPRVALTATNAAGPVSSPTNSLLVFNTATAGSGGTAVTPGYYFWYNNQWNVLATGGSSPFSPWTGVSTHIYNNNAGSVYVGSSTIPASNPYKFLVDAGTTTSYNLMGAKGSYNNYLQLNVQNTSSGAAASSDIVASNNSATETTYFVDMGINSSGNTTTDALGGPNNAYLYNKSGNLTIGTASADKNLRFITGGQTEDNVRVKIDSIGNVGIGANYDISTSRLTVDGGVISSAIDQDLGSVVWITGDRNQFLELNIQNTNNGTSASSDIVATANNGSDSTNYIDMGINSQNYSNAKSNILNKSNVAYLYANAASNFKIGNGGLGQSLILFTNPSTGTLGNLTANGLERVRVDGNGNVGIGDYSGTSDVVDNKLTVDGNVAPRANNSYDLGADGTGANARRWRTVYAVNAFNQSSDRRLKTNISNLKYGLDEVLRLQPVTYNWKKTPDTNKQIGLIAQDVRPIIPEMVEGDESKEDLSMKYTDLIPVLINAIKEQQKQIDVLKQQVQKLQK